jgi:hypothetical protein
MTTLCLENKFSPGHNQELLDNVVLLFTNLLDAAGASRQMIADAMSFALANTVHTQSSAEFRELGSLQRDCMEVICAWRRDAKLVDEHGEPRPLHQGPGEGSFGALCSSTSCEHDAQAILRALLDFGAVSLDEEQFVVLKTPTFLLARGDSGGRLATDGLLKQLKGFLQVVHRNVLSVSGSDQPRFERACTVAIAAELEPIFAQFVRTRGQEFVDSVDEWLERNAKRPGVAGRYLELGAGAYFIDLGESARRPRRFA